MTSFNIPDMINKRMSSVNVTGEHIFAIGGTSDSSASYCNKVIPSEDQVSREAMIVKNGLWTQLSKMKTGRFKFATAVLVRKGVMALIAIGGLTKGAALRTCELLEIREGKRVAVWRTVSPLPIPSHSASAIVAGDYVYLVGGRSGPNNGGPMNKTIYRMRISKLGAIVTGTWENLRDMKVGMYYPSLCVVGRFLFVIGGGQGSKSIRNVSVLDTTTLEIGSGPRLLQAREMSTCIASNSGIIVIGGRNEGTLVSTPEFIAWGSNSWVNCPSDVKFENLTGQCVTVSCTVDEPNVETVDRMCNWTLVAKMESHDTKRFTVGYKFSPSRQRRVSISPMTKNYMQAASGFELAVTSSVSELPVEVIYAQLGSLEPNRNGFDVSDDSSAVSLEEDIGFVKIVVPSTVSELPVGVIYAQLGSAVSSEYMYEEEDDLDFVKTVIQSSHVPQFIIESLHDNGWSYKKKMFRNEDPMNFLLY